MKKDRLAGARPQKTLARGNGEDLGGCEEIRYMARECPKLVKLGG